MSDLTSQPDHEQQSMTPLERPDLRLVEPPSGTAAPSTPTPSDENPTEPSRKTGHLGLVFPEGSADVDLARDAERDADTDAERDADTDAERDAVTDVERDAVTDVERDADTDAGCDADADSEDPADTGAPHASSFSGRFGVVVPQDPELPLPTADQPRAGVRVRRRRRLQLIAAAQAGAFSTAQAARAGYDRRARHHHRSYGNWRATDAPGVFRLTSWPEDPHERVRAWALATSAPLTSWTALELLGLTAIGPWHPVDVAVTDRERRGRLLATTCSDPARVRVHRVAGTGPAVIVEGIPVRPAAESICVAVMTARSRELPLALTDELIADGRLDAGEVLRTSIALRAAPLRDHLWLQSDWSRADGGRSASSAHAPAAAVREIRVSR